MSSLGDKIKAVLGGGHSSEAEKGDVDHRTPGAFPEDSNVQGGADQPHVGTKPVPSSGERDLGGTSQDPGFITGTSEHNSTHNKLHKKDDPRGNTSYPAHDTSSTSGLGSSHNTETGSGARQTEYSSNNPFSSSANPSSYNDSSLATDRSGRPDTSAVPGTGYAGGTTGLPLRELGEDRAGQQTERLPGSTTGTTGTSSGLTGTGNTQPGSHTGRDAGLAGATAATAGALAGHGGNHNKVGQQGVQSEVTSEEPYWGDLPQGAGVYNTVTGHGSGEDTSGQHRTIPRADDSSETSRIHSSGDHQLPQGTGVYNTVTGHGSNRDGHEHTNSSGQREFPLASSSVHGGATGTAVGSDTTGSRLGDDSHRDGHLGEAGALGAGAAAYGAHEHNKHNRDATGSTTGTSATGNREGDLGPHNSRVANALDPRVDSDRDGSRTAGNTGTTSGVSGTGLGSDTSSRREGDNSHRDRHIGEAGALGAGAAAYGAHEHHKHSTGADYDKQRADAPGTSSTHHAGSSLEPTSTNQPRDASHSGGILHRHRDQTEPVAPEKEKTGHHHEHGGILGLLHRNKDPKDIDQPAHEKSHFTTHHGDADQSALTGATGANQVTSHATSSGLGRDTGLGSDNTRPGHDDSHTGRNIAGLGAAAGAGYGASQLAQHHHNEPQTSSQYGSDSSPQASGQYGSTTVPGEVSTSQHAAVPGSHATTVTGQPHPLSGDNSSHTGRDLAGAGAAAGTGYEASRLAHHHNEPSIGQRDSSLPQTGQSGATSGLTGSQGPTGTTSHASVAPSTYSQESSYSQDPSSHTGRNLAGAGAAAGAGYEASRLAHHHNEPSIGQQDSSLQGTSTGQREGDNGPYNSRAANALDPRVDSDRDGSRTAGNKTGTGSSGIGVYNKLSDDTPSGVAASNLGDQSTSTHGNQVDPTSRSAMGGEGYNRLSDGTPSGVSASNLGSQTTSTYGNQAGTGSHSGTTSHSKTAGGDNYNHLASGTPSGVVLETQEKSARAAGLDPSTSSSTTGTHTTSSGQGY